MSEQDQQKDHQRDEQKEPAMEAVAKAGRFVGWCASQAAQALAAARPRIQEDVARASQMARAAREGFEKAWKEGGGDGQKNR